MSVNSIDIGLGTVRKILDLWQGAKADSLVGYTQSSRVEPITLIDSDCMFHEAMPEIMQSMLSIFTGYYLQAVALSTTVGNVQVGRTLDKLNPNRSIGNAVAGDSEMNGYWLSGLESYKHRLPTPGNVVAMEAEKEELLASAQVGRNATDQIKELANLSVGKLVNVEITDGEKKATIPIQVRLISNSVPTQRMVHILSSGSQDTSVKERWHAWRAGRLNFIKDLVFCQDLIDAHRKKLMADKDGILQNIMDRRRSNNISAIISGNISVANASNLVVLSADTVSKLELEVNGKFSDFRTREKIFKDTYLMIVAVLDKQWDRVTFYHRGIPMPTEVGVRDLKVSNKNSGPDLSDILKAYSMGSAPSL